VSELDTEGFELDGRELCSDGACTGIIGPDGRCKVCGRAADGSGGARSADSTAGEPDLAEGRHDVSSEAPDFLASRAPEGEGPPDFEARELCPDGACTGLIGPDGHCKVCGRTATS
jgi:hypothetical protein